LDDPEEVKDIATIIQEWKEKKAKSMGNGVMK